MSVTRQEAPVRLIGVVIAGAATIAVVALFWFFERDLLWMAGVLTPAIWVPLAVRDEQRVRKWALPALVLGWCCWLALLSSSGRFRSALTPTRDKTI